MGYKLKEQIGITKVTAFGPYCLIEYVSGKQQHLSWKRLSIDDQEFIVERNSHMFHNIINAPDKIRKLHEMLWEI